MCFAKAVSNKKAVKLANLPPTVDAARQHFYTVYLQVQQWLSSDLLYHRKIFWTWFSAILRHQVAEKLVVTEKPAFIAQQFVDIMKLMAAQIVEDTDEEHNDDEDNDQNETSIQNIDDDEAANVIEGEI